MEEERLQAEVERFCKASPFVPGISVAVGLADGRVVCACGGCADLEARVPLGAASARLMSGSVGKTFVAALVASLAAQGRLALDDPAV
jgi:CubicO group peptidase (beta-lactamase class C family)